MLVILFKGYVNLKRNEKKRRMLSNSFISWSPNKNNNKDKKYHNTSLFDAASK